MSTSDRKAELRVDARSRRRGVVDPIGAGAAMATHAMDVLDRFECVAVYLSYGHEPSTEPLIALLRSVGITVIAPRIAGDSMTWCVIDEETAFDVHELGMREPIGSVATSAPDAVILPALAVDLAGHRLGQGRGYYDRYLETLPSDVLRIAFVYDDDVIDDVPTEPHDASVNVIVTERRLIATS